MPHIGTGPLAGRWMNVEAITLFDGDVTADANAQSFEVGSRRVARLTLDVLRADGDTPELDVAVETSADGATWYTSGAFTTATVIGSERKCFRLDRFVRVGLDIEGTGNTPGVLSAVTQTGPGPAIAAAGEPDADYDIQVEVTLSGVNGTGEYRWSLDGGSTWEEEDLVVPTTPFTDALGTTGVTLTFADALGTVSSVAKTGTGPNITTSGTPDDAYDFRILISANGDREVGEFYWSLDGGDTFEEMDVVIPAAPGTYALGTTGMSITFAAGAYVDGDVYSFTTTAPNPYQDGTTYDITATAPVVGGGDSNFEIKVSGELV